MAVKVCVNGQMKAINTNLHKPVIFLNGQKKVLDKAWIFINGQKKLLWGETGVQIDYISSTGSLGGGNLFAIGNDWADCYYSGTVYRINISNLSNPTLIQSVAWGSVENFNGYQTTSGNMVFSTSYLTGMPSTTTSNKMVVNPATGVITINRTDTYGNFYLQQTDGMLATYSTRSKSFATSHSTISIQYGTNFYWNGVLKYSTGREPTSASDTSGLLKLNGNALQVGQNSILFNLTGNYGNPGLYVGNDSTYSRVNNAKGGLDLYDDNAIVRSYYSGSVTFVSGAPTTKLSIMDKTSYNDLYSYDVDFDNTGNVLKFLGCVGDYYYVIVMPNNSNATSGVKLVLLDKSNLSVVFTKDLPADPFGENSGRITFWSTCKGMPQVSQTGFIGAGTYTTGSKLRIVRFSEIF